MASFSVAMLAKEDRAVLELWADHYVELGAQYVTIYTDGPAGPAADLAGGSVSIIPCEAAFWRDRYGGPPPRAINERQAIVARHALDTHDTDWLLFLDSDEFVIAETPFATALDTVPKEIDAVRLPNHEAVWGPGDPFGEPFGCTYLRRRATSRRDQFLQLLAYGPTIRFLSGGLAGHGNGKQLRRTGARYDKLENHVTYRNGEQISVWAWNAMSAPAPWFIHFDAISLDRVREKFRRRSSGETTAPVMGRKRESQIAAVKPTHADNNAEADRFFRRIYQLSHRQAAFLGCFGLAWRYRHPLLDRVQPQTSKVRADTALSP